ncbi:hypothetical protein N2P39_003388 [Vibrio cholerae]|nr:hypothetical protein [Vibrio cholerae]
MKRKMLLISFGWIYFILPIVIFSFPFVIIFTLGYILGGNSITKLSDFFSILGNLASIGALLVGYLIAINWRSQLFSTKLIEKILKAKYDLININLNSSEILVLVRCKISNKIISEHKPNPGEMISFCDELSEILKNHNPNKKHDLLTLSILQDDLSLFLPDKVKLTGIISRYREYYYISCFSGFRFEPKNKGCSCKENGVNKFLNSNYVIYIKFFLPENIKHLSIENELRDLGVKLENGEFSGDFSLEKLEWFYRDFSIKFDEVKDELAKEIDEFISNEMKSKFFR